MTQASTCFASAERTGPDEIARKRARFASDPAYTDVLDRVHGLVLVLDRNRQVVYSNSAARTAVGAANDEWLVGQRPGELLGCVHAGEAPGGCGTAAACRYCGAVAAILRSQSGERAVTECRMLVKRGESSEALDLRVWASPIDLDGERYTFFEAADIAAEKRRLILEKIFLHDLANTAGALRGFAELMGLGPGGCDEAEALRTIDSLSKRLVDEIQAHRLLVGAESGELQVHLRPVLSLTLLREVHSGYQRPDLLGGRRLEIAAGSRDVAFESDPALLGRVLGNMTKNAIEASAPGQLVTLGCEADDGEISFSVHNPGCMPEAVTHQVFNRSFSTKGAGRGLGTYSMKLLTEKYLGGRISFSSDAAAGTAFVARYPLRLARAT